MQVSILTREPMTVVGWKRKFRSILATDEGSSNEIGDLWMNTFKYDQVSKLPGSLGHPTWGVIWADPPEARSHPAELNYLAGVPFSSVPELPEGMASYSVPGGTFAMITHKGALSGLRATIESIHKWVEENGYTEPTSWCDLELYDERFFKPGPEQEMDYFINIVPAIAEQPPNVTIEPAPAANPRDLRDGEETGKRSREFNKRRTDALRPEPIQVGPDGKPVPSGNRKGKAKRKATKAKPKPRAKKKAISRSTSGKARKKSASKPKKRPAKSKRPARRAATRATKRKPGKRRK
jgi:predicted transcriptional regulator YdeE